ncbi:AraC family transcriptional regulator [Sphingopyxis sp.]|uniref:AraC family transcriptional regulator n=1 Tax=Sphingopyxis sp. TaxID=1908224 RepID=UPI002D77A634|nr:AraC family transcriptional regulator [Sphingopyxis sp.]HET6526987.1 AraC family transcriptional regulator [Sphingopyxis sp.]
MTSKRAITISAEFASFVGHGPVDPAWLPPEPIVIGFGDIGEPAVSILASEDIDSEAGDHILLFAIGRSACLRMFGLLPSVKGSWYLAADLRELGRALVAVEGESEVAGMLRVARSLELLCRLFGALEEHRMVEYHGNTTLSELDAKRVAAAHQLVSEGWQQPLTVAEVARRSGLGKAKLTQGFREMYKCTVAEAVSERRLSHARTLLSLSDLPISSIGYRCGYQSNASFTRAFARRFGMTPTDMRRREKAPDGSACGEMPA